MRLTKLVKTAVSNLNYNIHKHKIHIYLCPNFTNKLSRLPILRKPYSTARQRKYPTLNS